MDRFIAPVNHVWFQQSSMFSTPDNGVLYCSRFDIVHMSGLGSQTDFPKVQIMTNKGSIKSLACAPDWSHKRLFATLDESNMLVWDLDLEKPIMGHRGHQVNSNAEKSKKVQSKKQSTTSAICFTRNGKVVSCEHSDVIVYCMLTDSYQETLGFFRNKTVVFLACSPTDRDVFIAGMHDGLIQIFSIKNMTILHTLRGHDKEIVSIDCMRVPVLKNSGWRKEEGLASKEKPGEGAKQACLDRPKKQARKKAIPVADTSDFLDIYDFNDNQEEFGTIIDRQTQEDTRDQFREKVKTVEGFNFLEACENLKEDIMKAATRKEESEDDEDDQAGDRSGLKPEDFNTDDEKDLDDCEKLRDYADNDDDGELPKAGSNEEHDDAEHKLVLVSSSRENVLWFWDYETGLPIDKIIMPSDANNRLCDTIFNNAVWLDKNRVVANNAKGEVTEWTVELEMKNEQLKLNAKMNRVPYPVSKIFHIIRAKGLTSGDSSKQYVWCSSIYHKLICLDVTEAAKPAVALDLSCVTTSTFSLAENSLASMLVAVGFHSPKIGIINLANLSPSALPINILANKIGATATFLAWHPEDEAKLAFGTTEGRIGVFDTSSSVNIPVILKSFANNTIYALQWCYLADDLSPKRLVLFGASKNELAYYPMSGPRKLEPISCKQFKAVSTVSAVDNLCFIGTQKGSVHIADLDHNLKQLYQSKMAKHYISALEFKQNYLAVASNDRTIQIIHFADVFDDEAEKKVITLEGHTDGVCKVRWNRSEKMLLVSCSFDNTVRVWDVPAASCLKIFYTRPTPYFAIFSPLDENLILYVGKGCSLSCFDYTKESDDKPPEAKPWVNHNVKFAVKEKASGEESTRKKKTNSGSKKSLKQVDNSIEQLTDDVKRVTLQEPIVSKASTTQSTVFPLTKRESNKSKNVLDCIVKLLHTVEPEPEATDTNGDIDSDGDASLDEEDGYGYPGPKQNIPKQPVRDPEPLKGVSESEDEKMFYNEKLFSTEQNLKLLIEEEANAHNISESSSISLFMLPQLLHELKATILRHISKKKLTSQMLALAPYVSHLFWRQCCQAYAYQLIESQQSLAAVPYFLASHKIDPTIEELCEGKYYREAWVICRLQKMPNDPILEKVATKWAHHLDETGHYEAAALVWTGVKNYKQAVEVLEKRKEITEDIQRTIDELNAKLQEAASG